MTDEAPNCDNICAFHQERDKLIKTIEVEINESIGPTINQHKAYWRFFFWGAAFAIGLIGYLTADINASVKEIENSVNRMERFVAIGEVNHDNNVMRLGNIESHLGTVDIRLRELETGHYEDD